MKEQPIKIQDRKDRKYTLSPLGIKAVRWLKGEKIEDVNADFCCGCLRVVSKCRCGKNNR